MTQYDNYKLATPPNYDLEDCCDECFSPSHDTNFGRGDVAIPDGCKESDCPCHSDDDEIVV